MEDLFQVGIITGTHGLKGEVKVFPTTDDKERFLDLDTVLIDTGKELIEKKVQYCKFFKQFVFVKFEGLDDINDVEKYIPAFDIAVLPSKWEGFGLAIVEYMVCNKPIIASNVGGITDIIISEKNGLLFEVGDYEELSKKINFFLFKVNYILLKRNFHLWEIKFITNLLNFFLFFI